MDLLLSHKRIDVNKAIGQDSVTPIFFAANAGHLEIIKKLMNHPNIDINKGHKSGSTAFFTAARNNHVDIVEYFMKTTDVDVNHECDLIDPTALITGTSRKYLNS